MQKYRLFLVLLITIFLVQALHAAPLAANIPVAFSFISETDTLTFEIAHPGDRFLAIEADFTGTATSSGAIKIVGENAIKVGPVTWDNRFDRDLYAHDGEISIADNMLPSPGTWKLTVTPVSFPVSGKLKLIDLGPVAKIEYSEKTGAIQIKKPGSDSIVAIGKVEHPDFPGSDSEFTGSVTSDGDILIPLPAGYYCLRDSAPLVNSLQAQMIPVHPGKVTVVENWPQLPQPEVAQNDDSMAAGIASVSAIVEKELKIRSVKLLDNDQVSVRFATPQWQGVVSKTDLETQEGGVAAEVISAGTVASPLDLVILLDSSGSMKKDMKLAIDSVDQFIKLLPADSKITLIDFDTKTNEVIARDRTGLLKALKAIKADGATCLNDSVMLGLKKSENRDRPAVLLFTDGFDANHNDTGPGSKTKPEEMFEAVKTAEIPFFTIGFGAKPDDATLKRLATLSGGFYSKADKENISKVFARLASIIGREHEMVYKRPGVSGNSDAPVISIVLDVSGSMNLPPEEEGCDYRLEKAKAILRNMISKLPDDAITQITTYSYSQDVVQAFTGDKTQLLASLASLNAGGGTETLETLKIAFKMLKKIPTDRKYLLFITDAGLDIAENVVEYETVLGSIKDAGIHTTWIGMVDAANKAPFDLAAKLCNGEAVVSPEFTAVREAIDKLGKTILTASGTADGRIPVQLTFGRHEDNGRMLIMSGAEKFKMPAPPVISKAAVNGLKISFVDLPQTLQRYSLDLSQTLYGNSKTRDETIITQRLPINAVSSNKAMRLTVVEALLMSRFRGINRQCAAIKLRLENLLTDQPYFIPALRSRFFAKFNNLPVCAVSDLSLIVEDPLLTPEDDSLTLKSGEPVEGYLVFECSEAGSLKKAALSYFDMVNGHLQVPVIGVIDNASAPAKTTVLPAGIEGGISETFKLRLTGYADQSMPEPIDSLIIRVFDLQMTSQVQDLLDFNPLERLSLLLSTRFGSLVINPSPRSALLPMGWYRPVMFLPGSNNYLKQAYMLPKGLGEKAKGSLRVDIAGGEFMLSAGDQQVKPDKPIVTADGDKIKLAVNAYKIENNTAYFDLTLVDKADETGNSITVADLCQLQAGDNIFPSDSSSCEYMFQIIDHAEVADGQQRRFLLVINCQALESDEPVVLKSELFKLELPIIKGGQGKFDDYMLTGVDNYQIDDSQSSEIAELVDRVHTERIANGWKKKGGNASETAAVKSSDEDKILLPPDLKSSVSSRLQELMKMSEAEFIAFMQSIRCVPSEKNFNNMVYAPEAVLIQNWGTQNDLLELARLYFKSTGVLVGDSRKLVVLSERGKEELAKLTGWKTELEHLPVLAAGERNLVSPFFKDINELGDLITETLDEDSGFSADRKVSINISLRVKAKNSGSAAAMGSMGDSLGGESEESSDTLIPLLDTGLISYGTCSRSPIDIFYASPDNGKTLVAMAEGADGKIDNSVEPLSLAENEVLEEIVEIRFAEETLSFVRPIDHDVSIVDTFRTVALCLPDMPASASIALAEEFKSRKTAEAPGTRSTAKWFTRAKIYKFLAMHSEAEAEAVRCTGVKIGRSGDRMRAIILTLSSENGNLRSVFDLRQINPTVQGDPKAIKAFNFFMGTTNAMIEEHVMGGGGLLSRWSAGKQQKLLVVGPDEISKLVEGLNPELVSDKTLRMLEQNGENGKGVIFPTYAPEVEGKALASWFSFDPETYEMISVLDNGSHGSMVEQPITEIIQDAAKYGVGFFVGVNTSVWAVTAYSLPYDDMRIIVKAAKALCLGIAEQLENIGKPLQDLLPKIPTSYTAGELEASVGPASIKVGFGEITPDSFKLMTKPSISFNFSYQSGFEDAVKAYFHDN